MVTGRLVWPPSEWICTNATSRPALSTRRAPRSLRRERLDTDWETLVGWLAPLAEPRTIVMEATRYCWWLERKLTAARFTPVVVHLY